MNAAYDNLVRILSNASSPEQRFAAINGFASELEWTPNYQLRNSFGVAGAEDHLVVEHGLENSAIISFLKAPHRATDLDSQQLRALLTISYNNLVEWHIFVSETEARYVNNLTQPFVEWTYQISRSNLLHLSASYFDKLTSDELSLDRVPSRSLSSCDEALIQVVSRWKRLLRADYRGLDNEHISALFNALIFVRGCEDQRRSVGDLSSRLLLSVVDSIQGRNVNVARAVDEALNRCDVPSTGRNLLDFSKLQALPDIERSTVLNLLVDFYRPPAAPYEFNFALMSKHALSRIYERYVSVLHFGEEESRQLSFISPVPIEKSTAKAGAVYTPLFVASFFSRFIRHNLTPRMFRRLVTLDPACGSGIFLRTLLELQCNPLDPDTTPQNISETFGRVRALDRDPNACQATRLSLALLHLVATGVLPDDVNVQNADSVKLALDGNFPSGAFGAIVANPPYIKLEHLSADERETYSQYLGDQDRGRLDSYLAFVKLCLDVVEDGGFVCLVLPQVFLLANNAAFLRRRISERAMCVVS